MLHVSKSNTCKKGSVLVFSLIILSFLLISALSVAVVSVTDKKSVLSTGKSSVSFQTTDSGVEMVLQKVYKESPTSLDDLANKLGSGVTCASDGSISFDVAQGRVKISFYQGEQGDIPYTNCTASDWQDKVNKIKSAGTYANTTRVVTVGLKASIR